MMIGGLVRVLRGAAGMVPFFLVAALFALYLGQWHEPGEISARNDRDAVVLARLGRVLDAEVISGLDLRTRQRDLDSGGSAFEEEVMGKLGVRKAGDVLVPSRDPGREPLP